MIVLIHVLIALAGLALSTIAYAKPGRSRMVASLALLAATLASGTYLTVSSHAALTQACLSGLAYTAVVAGLLAAARNRLVRQESGKR